MSTWNDIVTAALLGTEKSQQSPALPATLGEALAPAEALVREEAFLSAAGAYTLWRRAGWKPPQVSAVGNVAEADDLPSVSTVSAGHLREMLAGRFTVILPEWLRTVAEAGRRVPPELLPALLDKAKQDRELRPLITATGGKRAAWLSTQSEAWSFGVGDAPDLWETGTRDQRVAVLRALRERDAAEARAKVQSVWKSEPADTRAAFLSAFEIGLSMDDEPFLEETLDDRSKEVRRVCVDLLSRLPESRLVARMTARATPLLIFKPGKLLSRAALEVLLPTEPDPAGIRDGLDPKAFGAQKKFGEKAVLLILILASVPPQHWSDAFGLEPSKILKLTEKDEFARALVTGWSWAAIRFQDARWAEAILDGEVAPERSIVSESSLLLLLPEAARSERLADQVRRGAFVFTDHERWSALVNQLESFTGYWPESLAREVLGALRRIATRGIPWHLRASVERLLRYVPPSLGAEATQGWPTDQEGIAALSDFLNFRHDALTAIHNTKDLHA
ncbi:DUF5691 domain-containing protein [Verrucomicrobiota bacterium sgz303538]